MTSALPKIVAPPFDNGLCRYDPALFDYEQDGETKQDRQQRHGTAITFCHRCPVYRQCKAWLARLPVNERPSGVVAGHVLADRWTIAARGYSANGRQRERERARIAAVSAAQARTRMAGRETPAKVSRSLSAAVSAAFDELLAL